MAGSLNRVTLVGNVGDDPDIRDLTSGNAVANFSIATSEKWKDKNSGEMKEHTDWHRVVVWNDNLIEVIEKYVKKGSKLLVEGKLQTRSWDDNDGVKRYTTEVVLTGFDCKLLLLGDPRGSGDRDQNGNASRAGNGGSRERGEGRGTQRGEDRGSQRNDSGDRGRQDQRGNFSHDMDDDIPF